MNIEASHYVKLFGGNKIGNLIFWLHYVFRIHAYFGHYQSPNFIEHNSSGEANSSSVSEEITPHFMETEGAQEAAMCFCHDAN